MTDPLLVLDYMEADGQPQMYYRDASPSEILSAALNLEGVETVDWCTKHRSTAVPVLLSMCEVAEERFDTLVAAEDACYFVPVALVPIPETQ